jgi:hypothetical protein
MKRRELLRMLGSAGALSGAWLLGVATPVGSRLRTAAFRTWRAPADLLWRIRRRTRPLDERRLDEEHDLAG